MKIMELYPFGYGSIYDRHRYKLTFRRCILQRAEEYAFG